VGVLWIATARTVVAQEVPSPAVDLHGYRPSPFSDRFLRLDGSDVMPAWRLRVGLDADYALRPLLVDTPVGGGQASGAVVRHAAGASLAVALGIGERFEVALQLPATLYQTGDAISGAAPPDHGGLEAVRLGAKAHLLGNGLAGLGLGVAVLVDVPAGSGGGLVRDAGVGGEGRLFADFRAGRLTAGLGAGYRIRAAVRLYDVALDDELVGAGAASVRVAARTHVLGEVAGATAAKNPFHSGKQSPFEALVAVTQRLGGWTVLAGAGPGLVDGYGAPTFRAIAGVSWTNAAPRQPPLIARSPLPPVALAPKPKPAPPPPPPAPDPSLDSDGDGIPDLKDKCPNDAEDKDGFEDDDGCPDPDNDKDGIPDAADKCPNEPETFNGVDDQDGCPDTGGLVRLKNNELETLSPIFFDTDRFRVHHAFYPTLDAIAAVLKARPDVGRCAIEGHADATGPPDWNQVLSMKRAEAVVRYLTEKGGVDPARLVPIGHGDDLPWAPNDTAAGRAANRRVIFHIEGVDPEQAAHGIEIQKQRALERGEKTE
jgi:outer membrane protein OmpA-like peptidoglycan-associated protein